MEYKLFKLNSLVKLISIANVHFFEFEKGFSNGPDIHPFNEIVFVTKGKLDIESDYFNGTLNKNELIIIGENESHTLKVTSNENPTVIIIDVKLEKNIDFLNTRIEIDKEDLKILANIVKEGRNLFKPPYDKITYNMSLKEDASILVEQKIKLLIETLLVNLIKKNVKSNKENEEDEDYKLNIDEIINYINNNIFDKIKIDEIAFMFNTNRTTLCKEFKKTTSKTVIDYINDRKITLIKERLLESNDSISKIASKFKFKSIYYFSRFFRLHTGISPNEFRKKTEQKKDC